MWNDVAVLQQRGQPEDQTISWAVINNNKNQN